MKTKSIFLTCLLFLVFLFPNQVHAARVGLSIDPPLLRVQSKPGKSITKIFKVENRESEDKNMIVRLVPFNKSDNLGNPLIDVKNTTPWIKYFSLSNSNLKLNEPFIIKANSSEQIILSISIPENANLEDLYLTVLVSTYDNILGSEQKGTLISATIGANILVSVTSELNPATILKIKNIQLLSGSYLKIGKRYFIDNLSPIKLTASAENVGKFTTETKGILKVTKNNQPVYLEGILPQYAISGSERKLLNSKGEDFVFKPTISNIGQHQIAIEIKSDNANSNNSIDIFLFPFKASGGLVLVFIVMRLTLKTKVKEVE